VPHFSPEEITRFVEGASDEEETKRITEHLLRGCADCLAMISEVAGEAITDVVIAMREADREVDELVKEYRELVGVPPASPHLDGMFRRLMESGKRKAAELREEKVRAVGQCADLMRLSPAQRLLRVSQDTSLYTFGMYERLIESAKEAEPSDPIEAAGLGVLALRVAEKLDPATYGASNLFDFQAGALSTVGNALRMASDFDGAAESLKAAEAVLKKGTRDPLETAHLLSLSSSLEIDLGYFEDAVASIEEAKKIYESHHETHMVGRMLVKEGIAIGHFDPQRGIALLEEAHQRIDPMREPRIELCIRHNVAFFLTSLGKAVESFSILEASRWLYKQFNDRPTRVRRLWLEGRISKAFGHLEEAEHTLTRATEEFMKYRLHQEYTLTMLELGEIYFLQGRIEETVVVIRAVYNRLRRWGMHEEGLAILVMAVNSVSDRKAKQNMFSELGVYLRRSWNRPQNLGPEDFRVN